MRSIATSTLLVALASSLAVAELPAPDKIYRSAPVSGQEYFLDYACDLINIGSHTIEGSLRLIDASGTTRASAPFSLDPGEVATLDEVTLFANGPRYCQADVYHAEEASNALDAERIEIEALGSLQIAAQVAESITTTPLQLVSNACDDDNPCTEDDFDTGTGRCINEPLCEDWEACVGVMVYRQELWQVQVPVCNVGCSATGRGGDTGLAGQPAGGVSATPFEAP